MDTQLVYDDGEAICSIYLIIAKLLRSFSNVMHTVTVTMVVISEIDIYNTFRLNDHILF